MADCSTCKGGHTPKPESVPYLVYESAQARNERTVKRLIIGLIVAVIAIVLTNCVWLYAWNQYDYESYETVTVDGSDGVANYIGNDGDIYNGESDSTENPAQEESR